MISRRAQDEGGFVAGSEALIFGVLVLLTAALVTTNAWAALDARIAASASAQAAVRAAVTAPVGSDLQTVASEAALMVWQGHGRDPEELDLRWVGVTPEPLQARCAQISFRVQTSVVAMIVPGLSSGVSYQVAASHTEHIERHRAGLPAQVCAP